MAHAGRCLLRVRAFENGDFIAPRAGGIGLYSQSRERPMRSAPDAEKMTNDQTHNRNDR